MEGCPLSLRPLIWEKFYLSRKKSICTWLHSLLATECCANLSHRGCPKNMPCLEKPSVIYYISLQLNNSYLIFKDISKLYKTEITNISNRVKGGVGKKVLRILLNYWFTKSTDSKSLFCYRIDLQVLYNKRSFKQWDWCFKLGNGTSIKVSVTIWFTQIQCYSKQ